MLAIVFGLMSSACLVVSSLSLKRSRILVLGLVINMFTALQYLLLGQTGALNMVAVGFVMTSVALASLKWSSLGSAKVLIGFLVAYPVVFFSSGTAVTSVIDILPLVGMMIATMAFFMKNVMVIKGMFITVGLSWLTFQLASGAYGAVPGEIITITGNIISFFLLFTAYRAGQPLDSVPDLAYRVRAMFTKTKKATASQVVETPVMASV